MGREPRGRVRRRRARFRVKVALLPAGHDPDTFLRAEGATAFAERIAAARSILSYALDRALADPDGATGPARPRQRLRAGRPHAGEGRRRARRRPRSRARPPLSSAWTRPSSGSRRSGCSPRCGRPAARAGAARAAPSRATARARPRRASCCTRRGARASCCRVLDERGRLGDAALRAIVVRAAARPGGRRPSSLMTDLPDDGARDRPGRPARRRARRSTIARRCIATVPDAPRAQQRLQASCGRSARRIAETQAKTGVDGPDAARRSGLCTSESAVVYEIAGGVAQSLEHGTAGSPRSSDE